MKCVEVGRFFSAEPLRESTGSPKLPDGSRGPGKAGLDAFEPTHKEVSREDPDAHAHPPAAPSFGPDGTRSPPRRGDPTGTPERDGGAGSPREPRHGGDQPGSGGASLGGGCNARGRSDERVDRVGQPGGRRGTARRHPAPPGVDEGHRGNPGDARPGKRLSRSHRAPPGAPRPPPSRATGSGRTALWLCAFSRERAPSQVRRGAARGRSRSIPDTPPEARRETTHGGRAWRTPPGGPVAGTPGRRCAHTGSGTW